MSGIGQLSDYAVARLAKRKQLAAGTARPAPIDDESRSSDGVGIRARRTEIVYRAVVKPVGVVVPHPEELQRLRRALEMVARTVCFQGSLVEAPDTST